MHASVIENHLSAGRVLVDFQRIVTFTEFSKSHVPKQVVDCIQ